ncbi:MAG: Rieske (2Fe-2S) protein [Deltaproteobacteria bacterium]|nr:Rieske (2Fe-2S) protein [Deltaproteobacteria bacterium]
MTTRREFLVVVGAAVSAGAVVPACGAPDGPVDAGNVADIAEGQVMKVVGGGVLLGRDAGGLYAMTSFCTHLGCDLTESGGVVGEDGVITCGAPCGHGSRYDFDGNVLGGPAANPLKHWLLTVADDGAITVEVGSEVDAAERVIVA